MNSTVISAPLIALVVPLVLRWISSGASESGVPGTLAYGTRPRRFAAVMAVVPPIAFGMLALWHPPRDASDGWAFVALEAFFPAICAPLCIEFFRLGYQFDETGIHVRSPWSRRRTLRWSEVRVVRWRQQMKWLDLSDGSNVVHISPWLTGLPSFAEACRAHLQPSLLAKDADVDAVLRLMAASRGAELAFANVPPRAML